jgi:hypothetical protein
MLRTPRYCRSRRAYKTSGSEGFVSTARSSIGPGSYQESASTAPLSRPINRPPNTGHHILDASTVDRSPLLARHSCPNCGAALSCGPSPTGRRWPEGPDEGGFLRSSTRRIVPHPAFGHPLPVGEGRANTDLKLQKHCEHSVGIAFQCNRDSQFGQLCLSRRGDRSTVMRQVCWCPNLGGCGRTPRKTAFDVSCPLTASLKT